MKKISILFKKFKKRLGKWFWVILIAIIAVLLGLLIFRKDKKVMISTTVQKGEIKEELVLSGTVKAAKHSILYFPTYGKISWVGVSEGDFVKKWQGLTSLDKTVLNAVYQQALNTYRNYQASAENVLDSVQGHSNDETFSQKAARTAAEVARDSAYDAVVAAEYNLKNATIVAPFDGIITSLPYPNAGVNVGLSEPQVEIVDPNSIYFSVDADQTEVINLKVGQSAVITLDSFEKEYKGLVSSVGYTPKSGESNVVYEIKVNIDGASDLAETLRVGMTGDVTFILSQKDDALFVPSRFINSDQTGKYVYLGNRDNKVYIKTGIEGEENIEIIEGVKEGETLYD